MPVLGLLGGVSARALGFSSSGYASGESAAAAALFNFTTHSFTTGGNVGRYGPAIATLRNTYSSQAWAQNAQYFFQGRSQGYQVFRIPVDGIYEIEVAGARGQDSTSGLGNGLGAIVKGRFALTQNTLLEMVVGQVPGNSGSANPSNTFSGGGGGSFVCLYNTSNPLIIAGGGGGTYSSAPMGNVIYSYGSTSRRGHAYSGYSPASYNSNMPANGQGGYGYHGGGGGGLLSGGQAYSGYSGSAAMSSDTNGQLTTHGASFVGGSIDNAAGTWYATGGNATNLTSEGGFGGGGGGHSGNNSGGGGGGYTGGMGGQTSLGGSYLSGLGGGSYIDSTATNVATSDGLYDGSGTFNGQAITNLNSYRNGSGYITITLISVSSGGGGAPAPPPVSYSQWADGTIVTSNNIGLSSTVNQVGSDYVVTDTYGTQWKIFANWGYSSAPTRWNGVVWRDAGNTSHVISRVGQQAATSSLASQVTPGILYRDAVNFSNASGQGFSNWYTDSKSDQSYPNLNTYITNYYSTSGNIIYDGVSNPDSNGGAVWFEPPLGTVEVMLDFGNSHSNGPCSISVIDKTTGLIVKPQIWYGRPSTVNVSANALNDPATRTVIYRHQPNWVYFNTDHSGTIAGSHYYLYR